MQVAFRFAVPVGLVRWRSNETCYSPFVKLTYELGASGWAATTTDPTPISEGDVESGRVLRPSDFAEAKGACEVALVGRVLAEHVGPVRLRVAGLSRDTPRIGVLGPASVGGGREYFSSEENRLPFPSLPLEITVEGIAETLRSVIPAPIPHLALVFSGGWASLSRVPLFIDSVLIDARRQRCSVVFRGFFTHPGDVDRGVTLVVDALGRLDETTPKELAEWPRGQAIESGEEDPEGDSDEGDDAEEELTPPRGASVSSAQAPTRGESTMQMRAVRATTDEEEDTAHPAKKESRPNPKVDALVSSDPSGTLPIGVTSPVHVAVPQRRSPAHSVKPVPQQVPSRPPLPSKYGSTQALSATPSYRQTLPFVAPGEGTARHELPFRPPPPPRSSSGQRDPSETTQLISLSDIEAKRAALPFGANAHATESSAVEKPPAEKRERPKRVVFERPPADPEQTELVPGAPLNATDTADEMEDEQTPLPITPTKQPPRILKSPGGFDRDESTAQIQLPVQGPVLPFQDEGTTSGLAVAGGKGMVLGLTSLGRKDEPSLAPAAFPPMPVHVEPIEGIVQDVAFEEALAQVASDTMPPPPQTMPPPAGAVSDAPAWFSPTGAALPPPPALSTLLSEMGASAPIAPMPATTAAPVWRPKPVAPALPEAKIADKLPTLTLDEYAALRTELWSANRPRRDVLKSHGLTELRWRAIERKWAKEIDSVSGDPDKLMPILSRLQSFAEAATSRT